MSVRLKTLKSRHAFDDGFGPAAQQVVFVHLTGDEDSGCIPLLTRLGMPYSELSWAMALPPKMDTPLIRKHRADIVL